VNHVELEGREVAQLIAPQMNFTSAVSVEAFFDCIKRVHSLHDVRIELFFTR